jgi:copper chaperone NosL
MVIADRRFPAQIVARGHDPLFFDDVGCLTRYLAENPLPEGARVFVTDFDTRKWIPAEGASFHRCDAIATPMQSGIIATTGARGSCTALPASAVLGGKP